MVEFAELLTHRDRSVTLIPTEAPSLESCTSIKRDADETCKESMCCVVLLSSCGTKCSRADTRMQTSFSKKEPVLLSFAHD
jgi:hypothetical protein